MLKETQKGSSTFEIIICLALVGIIIPAVILLVVDGQSMVISSGLDQEALPSSLARLEESHTQAKTDFLHLENNSQAAGGLEESVNYTDLTSYVKVASAKSSWGLVEGSEKYAGLDQLFVDVANYSPTETCAINFYKDWAHPKIVNSFNITELDPSAGPAFGLDAANGKLYLALNYGAQSTPDLAIVDISNPDVLTVMGSVNTGPGLEDVINIGNYVYAANTSINGQLEVIDVSNPANPVIMKALKIDGVTSGGMGHKIFYYHNKIYLGLTKAGGAGELQIFDVSNPVVPVWQGQFELDTMVNDLFVSNNWVFVSTPEKELRVLDVTDPAHIIEVGNFTAPAVVNHPGKSLYVLGKKIIMGRSLAGFDSPGQNELYSLATDDFSTFSAVDSFDADYSVRDLLFRSDKVFTTGNGNNKEFEIYNIGDDGHFSFLSNLHLLDSGAAFDCEKENFFVALETLPEVTVVTGN